MDLAELKSKIVPTIVYDGPARNNKKTHELTTSYILEAGGNLFEFINVKKTGKKRRMDKKTREVGPWETFVGNKRHFRLNGRGVCRRVFLTELKKI